MIRRNGKVIAMDIEETGCLRESRKDRKTWNQVSAQLSKYMRERGLMEPLRKPTPNKK